MRLGRGSRIELATLHAEYPQLRNRPFREQDAVLKGQLGYGTSDVWSATLRELGHDAIDVVANHTSAQQQWAREHGLGRSPSDLEVTLEQARRFSPEVLFVGDVGIVPNRWVTEARAACPELRLVVGWCGVATSDRRRFRGWDVVLSCLPEVVDDLRRDGRRAEHLHHAFDDRALDRLDLHRKPRSPITFAGQLLPFEGFHAQRARLVTTVADELPLTIHSPRAVRDVRLGVRIVLDRWGYRLARAAEKLGLPSGWLGRIPHLRRGVRRREPPPPDLATRLRPRMGPPRYGLDFLQLLRDSEITLNRHNDLSGRWATNLRMFEATGVGSCLLTDAKDNLPPLFSPGTEVVSYRSAQECIERGRWLLDHPEERTEIARAGQRRTLEQHTYRHRAVELDELLTRHLRTST